jgi:hypothetical protein
MALLFIAGCGWVCKAIQLPKLFCQITVRIQWIRAVASALIPTAFQELIHRFIHCGDWPDNRPRSLKILALQRKTRTIRRPCGPTAGILIYKNLND